MLRTSMKMAAAALAAGAVLTACGSVKMGAAAVTTSQRISTSKLAAEVSNLNQGYQRYKGKISLQYPVSQMPQQVLGWLVRFRVRDQLAADHGISVTPAQTHQALRVGHLTASDPAFARQFDAAKSVLGHLTVPVTATKQAYNAVYSLLDQQAHLWAFVDNFYIFGLLALGGIPLIFLFKRVNYAKKPPAAAH